MKYHLSGRQLKSLLIRHTPLCIALPAPEDDPSDWHEWAASVLDAHVRPHLASADPDVITVGPGRGVDGLASVIGEIEPRDRSIVWQIEVVICDLNPVKSLHPRERLQWPKCVDTESGRWPREES